MDRITTFWWSSGAPRCRDDSAGPALRPWAVVPAGEAVEDQAVENWLMLIFWQENIWGFPSLVYDKQQWMVYDGLWQTNHGVL